MSIVTQAAMAQCEEQQKLTASDKMEGAMFGFSVSVNRNTAVVGAWRDNCDKGFACGSAYVYNFNGTDWSEVQKLTASDADIGNLFGYSVSVDLNRAIVGAWRDNCEKGLDCGSAYVYNFDGTLWEEVQKLTASDAGAVDHFGISVSVSGNTTVVGAERVNCTAGDFCGSAYVFRHNGTSWVEQQKLTASDAAAGDLFGNSISISGDTVIVGAYMDDCSEDIECGAVYVFQLNGTRWIEQQKLTASDGDERGWFGRSISISGKFVFVGANLGEGTAGSASGSVYVFRFNGTSWIEVQKLIASDARATDHFGNSVSVSGNTAAIGAFSADCLAAIGCGSVYIFRFNGTSWIEEQKLNASDPAERNQFGGSVSVYGNNVLAGAILDDCDEGENCGAAYVFSCASTPTVVNLDIKPGSCANPVNPRSKGMVPVALIGSLDFDVNTVDPDFLTLSRTDGVGGSVNPISGQRVPRMIIEDFVTPLGDEPCTCHELGGDGIDDLSLKFSTSEMSRALELDALLRGETIELVLRGTLFDGTTFEATDCITVLGKSDRQGNSLGLRSTRKPK